jgi:hypothetical protein
MGGLYAVVRPQYLHDGEADRAAIFRSFGSMKANMAKDATGQDLAVILFSGHGAIIGDTIFCPMASTLERKPTSRGDFGQRFP